MNRYWSLRASDADREAVISRLREAAGEGRLEPEELEERVEAALRSRTYGELAGLVADLPGERRWPARPRARASARAFLVGAGVAAAITAAVAAVAMMAVLVLAAAAWWGLWLAFWLVCWGASRRLASAPMPRRARARRMHRSRPAGFL
jgi:hypothetical protein